jgi:SAM-dependent methyltransferase
VSNILVPDIPTKYDGLADQFTERTYTNLRFYMRHRLAVVTSWGRPLQKGDSILELGCGDGYLARLFVQYGLQYHGVDLSPRMVAAGKRRLRDSGLAGEFTIANVEQMPFTEPFDAVVSFMGTFFDYVQSPLAFLKRLRPYVRKKLVVDLSPRFDLTIRGGVAMLREAGFRNVSWRPFLVPQQKRLPTWFLRSLVLCEDVPLLRTLPLRWKFHCLLTGEP